jgi:hypothetical protein
MSEQSADTAAVVQQPPAEILPAKSEDKLEIEKEEQEAAIEANKEEAEEAAKEAASEEAPASAEDTTTEAATEDKKEEEKSGEEGEKKGDKKKFSLPKVKAPKVLTELRSKSKERKKVEDCFKRIFQILKG